MVDTSVLVFLAALAATFLIAVLGRRHSKRHGGDRLQNQKLNRWLIGLSAGATANSGFVVTGAVALGYTQGAQWMMLPLAWLIGDIVFWLVFPGRINEAGKRANAETITDVIAFEQAQGVRRTLKLLVATVVLICLTGYVAAQWIAGEKFLEGAFGFDGTVSLLVFAGVIIAYTAIGGFRGSVYADSLQAAIRIIGTAAAFAAVVFVASRNPEVFSGNIAQAGPDFLNPFPQSSVWAAIAFVLGFAASALGFGLGQPQIVTRYLAGASPEETRSAWWIYMGFVQLTWLLMTAFGMVLRGIMLDLADPETGLTAFFRLEMGALLTGLIAADVFATVAATANSLLITMSQTFRQDLLGWRNAGAETSTAPWPLTAAIGFVTMIISTQLSGSVVTLALSSVALMGAGLAPAMMARVLGWRSTGSSLIASIVCGFTVAVGWKVLGLDAILNEAIPGIVTGVLVNYVVASLMRTSSARRELVEET